MGEFAPKPAQNIPVALRLVTRITSWTVSTLRWLTTEPMATAPPGAEEFYLYVYQWQESGGAVRKTVSVLRNLLEFAAQADSEYEALSRVPPDLFVYSDDLEAALVQAHRDHFDEPLYHHNQPDWVPNLHGIQGLVKDCPEALRGLVSLKPSSQTRSRAEKKAETKARDDRIQEAFADAWRAGIAKMASTGAPKPLKEKICEALANNKDLNPDGITASRIERIVRRPRR
ncbi:hypothetical protein [Thiorhodovibrio frisius]|uniref:Uncharacterized protein n=1 Tax=Thiorhodovibrio frisius TaxID=631362 RepID=H8Z1J9_9GAMM|nr:hypothetical protein [Thiorhodovibrio frisius]EIC21444.1 hypothetical protein Thi970DRAFT_01652 [Thiorhodovibrio frisius]WPL24030.1 hypothetical protein Thiofri_04241 [Thiorhodovibrio frisius]